MLVAGGERRRRSVFDVIPGVESSGLSGEGSHNGNISPPSHGRSGGPTLQVSGRGSPLHQAISY